MEALFSILEMFINAVMSTIDAIGDNIVSFIIIFIFIIAATVVIMRGIYKQKRENLREWEERLQRMSQDIEKEKKEFEKKSAEYDEMKAELESKEYQAYLNSKGIHRRDLDDSDMFSKR